MDGERGEAEISSELRETLEEFHEPRSGEGGTLVLSEQKAYVGDTVTLEGHNFPPEYDLELRWHTAEGEWGMIAMNEVIGPQYSPRIETIGTVTTDTAGSFEHRWSIPEDYGGAHTVEARSPEGDTMAEAQLSITPWFEIESNEEPLGGVFTVKGYGLGPNFLTNNYQIAWDNGVVGFMTGVKNRGTATAKFRAVGPPGTHLVQVWRNYHGIPYLQNNTQSPYGPVAGGRQTVWEVEVTEPDEPPESAWADRRHREEPMTVHYPDIDEETAAILDIAPNSGPPGTTAAITGRNFPSETTVDLVWYRHEGEHVQGIPVTPEPRRDVLPTVTTDEEGRFQAEVTVPADVGATRPITAEVDGRSVAITGFVLQPGILNFSPTKGPVGTEFEIEISGIGWTEYDLAPFVVYDNKYLGYLCGQDLPKKRTVLRATGEPGYHFIDIYPTMFPELDTEELDFDTKPHLSYVDNHPGRQLPALHFAFEVTE